MVSLWSLAVIAFERWLVVCKPLGNFVFKPNHAIACCALTWVCAMIAATPPLVGWSRSVITTYNSHICFLIVGIVIRLFLQFFHNWADSKYTYKHHTGTYNIFILCLYRYIPEGMQCSCGPDWYTTGNKYNTESYVIFLFGFCFAVPFSTIVFCYSQLLFMLKAVGNVSQVIRWVWVNSMITDEHKISPDFKDLRLWVGVRQINHLWVPPPWTGSKGTSWDHLIISQVSDLSHRSSSTGGEGPSWVCIHPEGREGGDQDGGGHGAGLPGVLPALCLLCDLDCQQSWATIWSENGHHTLLCVKSLHSVQPRYLYLPQQTGWFSHPDLKALKKYKKGSLHTLLQRICWIILDIFSFNSTLI